MKTLTINNNDIVEAIRATKAHIPLCIRNGHNGADGDDVYYDNVAGVWVQENGNVSIAFQFPNYCLNCINSINSRSGWYGTESQSHRYSLTGIVYCHDREDWYSSEDINGGVVFFDTYRSNGISDLKELILFDSYDELAEWLTQRNTSKLSELSAKGN